VSGFPSVGNGTALWVIGMVLGLGLTALVVGSALGLSYREADSIEV
jgi:hypothetical protein